MLVDFQKKHGLTPDGKFGPITAKKIVEVFNIKHPAIFFGQDKYNLLLFRIVLNKCIFINISC